MPTRYSSTSDGFGWYAAGAASSSMSTAGGAADGTEATEGAAPGATRPEFADVGKLARRAVRGTLRVARADDAPSLSRTLLTHLSPGEGEPVVVQETWPAYEHVNVQVGLDSWLAEADRRHRVVGIVGYQHREVELGELLSRGVRDAEVGLRRGSVARVNVAAGPDGEVRACVQCAVYLTSDGGEPVAVLVMGPRPSIGQPRAAVEIACRDAVTAARVAARIRELTVEHNVFRGQVLSFGGDVFGHGESLLSFHRRPVLAADALVLPADTVAAVRRQVVDVARHAGALLAAGQHLKRGVLLYGPPGVGKTHTVRHLVSELVGTTVIELSGNALRLISEACSVARALTPAMVVIEDVDLIAEDRGMRPGQQPLLFELLNEMDGLAQDTDVVFVLTTNRADLLEPALAARPGRVDQAVELRPPDRDGRRALLALYQGRLVVPEAAVRDVLDRTDGVPASFLKELLRRAAVLAAVRAGGDVPLVLTPEDVRAALDELLDSRQAMTRTLLGAGNTAPLVPPPGGPPVPGVHP